MYNQCANVVLQYAIKTYAGQQEKPVKDITGKEQLPPPPGPKDIDCIIAGFPWHVHFPVHC